MLPQPRHLVFTLAFDPPGETGHRNLAKMLVSSLLRTRFSGDIVVFHNSPAPLFLVARAGVREVRVEAPVADAKSGAFAGKAQSGKHAVAAQLDPAGYDKIMFIDCDAVALRSIEGLLAGDWELAFFAERGTRMQEIAYCEYLTGEEQAGLVREGINSGTWAVAAASLPELLRRWREVEAGEPEVPGSFREQSAFNRVVLDWRGHVAEWPQHSIALPLCFPNLVNYRDYSRAAIVHAASDQPVDYKMRFLWSVFAGRFLWDPQLALFNIMEM